MNISAALELAKRIVASQELAEQGKRLRVKRQILKTIIASLETARLQSSTGYASDVKPHLKAIIAKSKDWATLYNHASASLRQELRALQLEITRLYDDSSTSASPVNTVTQPAVKPLPSEASSQSDHAPLASVAGLDSFTSTLGRQPQPMEPRPRMDETRRLAASAEKPDRDDVVESNAIRDSQASVADVHSAAQSIVSGGGSLASSATAISPIFAASDERGQWKVLAAAAIAVLLQWSRRIGAMVGIKSGSKPAAPQGTIPSKWSKWLALNTPDRDRWLSRTLTEVENGSAEATRELGEMLDFRVVPPLVAALQSQNLFVREAAADQLGFHPLTPRGVFAIETGIFSSLVGALHDQSNHVRRAAAHAIGNLGCAEGVEPLLAALRDSDPYVRRASAIALGKLKDPRALAALCEARVDSDLMTREQVEEAIALIDPAGVLLQQQGLKEPSADALVDPLVSVVRYDHTEGLRAARELGRIASPRAIQALVEGLEGDTWGALAHSTLKAIVEELSRLDKQLATRTLCDMYRRLPHHHVKKDGIVSTIAIIGGPEVVKFLRECLSDPDATIVKSAKSGLRKLGYLI